MLSFLHANAPAADPLTHLCNQMEAVDHEGTAFLIRLADTNALDAVLQVFNDAQRQRFLSDTQWWYFRRDGSLRHASHATGGGGDAEHAVPLHRRSDAAAGSAGKAGGHAEPRPEQPAHLR